MALGYYIAAPPLDSSYISQEVCAYVCTCVSITPRGCVFTGGQAGTAMGFSKQTLTQSFQ